MRHTFKTGKKAIALLLALIMALSVFSIVGFAEEGDDSGEPETPAEQFTVTFYKSPEILSSENPDDLVPAEVLGEPQTVPYGGSATAPSEEELQNLKLPEEVKKSRYTQVFDHWDKDFSNVTSDLHVFPVFAPVPKTYTIVYYNWNGEELNREDCAYGNALGYASTPSRDDAPLAYFYEFSQWALKQNIDLQKNPDDAKYLLNWKNGLALPEFDNPTEPDTFASEISVYPYFIRHNKEYVATFTVVDSYGDPVSNAAIQVRSATGQLLDQTEAAVDANGVSTGQLKSATGRTNSNGELVMHLPYQPNYTVEVSHETYGAVVKSNLSTEDLHALTLQLESPSIINEGGAQRCTDICHSFIGGVWIFGLNLLYYLFRVKYVCCYDMYAVHGSRLAYVA